jgi:hypothetical protein
MFAVVIVLEEGQAYARFQSCRPIRNVQISVPDLTAMSKIMTRFGMNSGAKNSMQTPVKGGRALHSTRDRPQTCSGFTVGPVLGLAFYEDKNTP